MNINVKFRRILKFGLAIVFLLALGGGAYVVRVFQRAAPEYTGHAEMPGLAALVSIYRDAHGVPHIFAADMTDAIRALGYVHASERMFQMEMQRRAGQGRLAEVIGSSMLGVDKFTRTLGFYRLAESSFTVLSPAAQKLTQAYADGVNAWLVKHKDALPPEFFLLGVTPEPWKPADSLVWSKLMALELSHNYKLEILRAQLAQKLTPEQLKQLFPAPDNVPVTTLPHSQKPLPRIQKSENTVESPAVDDPFTQLGKITGLGHAASNEWAIAGARTITGKPILANDPHLGLDAPILWYLARIVTPELSIKGATVPGLPVVLLGQNDHIAWGFTTTGSDVEDLFVETVDPKNPDHYLTPIGNKPFETHIETIHVKGRSDVALTVRATRHGPVLSDIDSAAAALAGQGKVMALAFTGLGDKDTTAEALMRLNRARNWQEFLRALMLYQAPPQNVAYADSDGNIGFVNPGLVPVRKKGDGLTPADGTSGAYDWVGTVPFSYLPQAYNPPAGFVFNANNPVARDSSLYFFGKDWEEPYRAQRLQQFFDTLDKHSLDTSAMMQADHISLAARQLLPYLLHVPPSTPRRAEALAMLKGWDGTMDKDRPEPLIFEAWLYQMHRLLLTEKTGDALEEKGPYAAATTASILANDLTNWCGESLGKSAENCFGIIAQAFDAALDMLSGRERGTMKNWRWGDEHITRLRNKFFSHIPILGLMTDLSVPSSGGFYTLDRGGSFEVDPGHPFARTHGGGFRGIYDLSDSDKSRFMIATGESGYAFAPHYGDLVPLWNSRQSITLSGTREDFAAQGLPELVLVPTK